LQIGVGDSGDAVHLDTAIGVGLIVGDTVGTIGNVGVSSPGPVVLDGDGVGTVVVGVIGFLDDGDEG
jgi:hypothetical protein